MPSSLSHVIIRPYTYQDNHMGVIITQYVFCTKKVAGTGKKKKAISSGRYRNKIAIRTCYISSARLSITQTDLLQQSSLKYSGKWAYIAHSRISISSLAALFSFTANKYTKLASKQR